MDPIGFLNWAIVAVSIFNTIALIWLGLTVLLNAERPRWGTYAVGGGLLLGGLFFTAHTTIVARDLFTLGRELAIWWRVIWLPFIAGPYLWYLVMAWHSGALNTRRHRIWLPIVSFLGFAAILILRFINPLPSYEQLRSVPNPPIFSIAGIPVALLVYPVYSTLCIVLATIVLRRPATTDRFMGGLARRRARPWLVAASATLLIVSLAVGASAAWVLIGVSRDTLVVGSYETLIALHWIDIAIETLIAVAIVLMGKAIVSYEIFTGKALPRSGLLRYWRNSLILAAGYGMLVAWSLNLPVDPIYHLMFATVLMTLFYALISWRSYAERDRSMQRLRPFLQSQHIYDQILGPLAPTQVDVAAPFRALCDDILDARSATLLPVGPLAPLVEALIHPTPPLAPTAPLNLDHELLRQLSQPGVLCLPIASERYAGAIWAIPLWSERGLIGALLLGPKRSDALYTQEEIEVARTAGERLIDTRGSAELARRLMEIQRRRLAESQVLDRRTRRVLHDDVLPQIHTAMILLQSLQQAEPHALAHQRPTNEVTTILAEAHRQIADLLHDLPATSSVDLARLGLIDALRAEVGRELTSAFDGIAWQITPDAAEQATALPALTTEVAFYAAREAIRNAARHGRGNAPHRSLRLTIAAERKGDGGFLLTIRDDGVGMGMASLSTGGAGRGLALHSTMLAVVGGTLSAERQPETGTCVFVNLPPIIR